MSEKDIVHEILSAALDADERDDTEKAVELYSKAVEVILKISNPTVKKQLNKYAVEALDRAEQLRGIVSGTQDVQAANVHEGHSSHKQVKSIFWTD